MKFHMKTLMGFKREIGGANQPSDDKALVNWLTPVLTILKCICAYGYVTPVLTSLKCAHVSFDTTDNISNMIKQLLFTQIVTIFCKWGIWGRYPFGVYNRSCDSTQKPNSRGHT